MGAGVHNPARREFGGYKVERLRTLVLPVLVLVLVSGVAAAQERVLQPNMPIEAALRPGDSPHEYTFRGESKQWVEVFVDQTTPSFVVEVLQPDGRSVFALRQPPSTQLVASFPVEKEGTYKASVRLIPRTDIQGGKYVLRFSTRPQTSNELTRLALQAELRALDAKWQTAAGERDVPTLVGLSRATSTHRFSSEDLDGVASHDEFLANAKLVRERRDNSGVRSSYGNRLDRVDVSDDIAIVTARFTEMVSTKPKPYTYHMETTRVWVKDATGWKVASEQQRMVGRQRHDKTATGFPPKDVLSLYVGKFRNERMNREVEFAIEGDALVARWIFPETTRQPFTMIPITDTTFDGFARDEITFVRSPDGRVREFIQVWEGPAFLFVRADEGPATPTATKP